MKPVENVGGELGSNPGRPSKFFEEGNMPDVMDQSEIDDLMSTLDGFEDDGTPISNVKTLIPTKKYAPSNITHAEALNRLIIRAFFVKLVLYKTWLRILGRKDHRTLSFCGVEYVGLASNIFKPRKNYNPPNYINLTSKNQKIQHYLDKHVNGTGNDYYLMERNLLSN